MTRLVLVLLLVACSGAVSQAADDLFEARRWLMGTELRLVIAGVPAARAEEIAARGFAQVAAVEESLSIWIADSALSRLNASGGRRVRVSDELAAYVERALEDHARTEGAFDPSVGTWRDPSPGWSRPMIGMQRVRVEREGESAFVTLPFAGFALDSGGNGKGIAVDRLVVALRRAGVESALVDFGGSSWYGLGRPPEGEAWIVQVPDPGSPIPHAVRLRDRALSVSSSMQSDVDESGAVITRPHIFDPRTGAAIEVPRIAVVTSRSAEDAEVLSTALIVEGEPGLRWLARYPGCEGTLLQPDSTATTTVDVD